NTGMDQLYLPSQSDNKTCDVYSRLSPLPMYDHTPAGNVGGGRSTSATSLTSDNQGRLSPRNVHSPKSPRSSPKQLQKSSSSNITTPKSDSGFYSLSGWSSLEKSPVSPKSSATSYSTTKNPMAYANDNLIHIGRITQQHPISSSRVQQHVSPHHSYADTNANLYHDTELSEVQDILPGGHRASSFKTVRTPTNIHLESNYFVPPPAPSESMRRSYNYQSDYNQRLSSNQPDFLYHRDEETIYSVAGSNRPHDFTSVYTSGASFPPSTTVSTVPDLIGPHTKHKDFVQHRSHSTSSYSSPVHLSKKTLTRVHSTGSVPTTIGASVSGLEGYRTAMYRTMFPTGKITDALTYYPTSNTYTSAQCRSSSYQEEQQHWESVGTSERLPKIYRDDSVSSSMSNSTPPAYSSHQRWYDHRYYSTSLRDPTFNDSWTDQPVEYSIDNRLRNSATGESSVQNGQSHVNYYDASSVIVSQSGYISISSDIKDVGDDKLKKPRRVGSLKAAMSSVSNWLPDLHLSKRHRSHSLPTGVRKEDLILSKEASRGFMSKSGNGNLARKKKKLPLMSSMSNILQKAKWRGQNHAHSMSDPEHSDSEWVTARSSLYDDSEDSVFSDAQSEMSGFSRMSQKSLPSTMSIQQQMQQHQVQHQIQQQQLQQQQTQLQQHMQQRQQYQMQQQHDFQHNQAVQQQRLLQQEQGLLLQQQQMEQFQQMQHHQQQVQQIQQQQEQQRFQHQMQQLQLQQQQ
ncbi:hypothetical protein LSTR_LSTR011078, partial [Laodelphax striatellus]